MSMAKKYNIGLDIGTNSVGWAVVETDNQKIIRKGKGKNTRRLWGIRLFDSASTAEKRRGFRSTRRRYDRRRERIHLLQEEFKEEINKVDINFFTKMKEAFFNEKDTINKTITLSKEEKNEIKKYKKEYKTIYHLREKLINTKEKIDIRLVYLAIHHIIKYRGNFLYNNSTFNVNNLNVENKLIECFSLCDLYYEDIDFKELSLAILDKSKNDRKILIKNLLSQKEENDFINEFTKLINANKFNFTKMLNIDSTDKVELSFNGNDYDEKFIEISQILGDDIEKLAIFKELYDMIFLKRLFKGSNNISISSLMVEKYNNHNSDLNFLKKLFNYDRTLYNKLFRTNEKNICLYEKYIKNKITYDEFIRELEKLLAILFDKNIEENLTNQYITIIKPKIENGEFLPRITDTDNGKYPYQLNEEELIKIIENQGKYYSFLKEKLGNNKYKLVQLLEFKIPYYVGPLVSEEKSNFAWMIRNNNEKITPYNFDEVINKEETAEKFIKRMLGHCTYFLDKYAIANNSILYSKYKLMNELKQIRINGNKIDNNIQHKIIKELFMKKSGTITDKIFKEYISSSGDFNMYVDDIFITGYSSDNKFANNLQSYIDFFGENGVFAGTDYNEEDADKIIELITIFDDKDMLQNKIKKLYPDLKEKIKDISNKKYKGWGNLSKEFLTQKYYKDKNSGIPKSILDLMYETEDNFMQILNNNEYGFQDMIKNHNKNINDNKISYKLVENLATSPATKRGIYQSLKVVEEIVKYMKEEPDSIMIEMARGEEAKKKRKDDRKQFLIYLYENSKKEIDNYNSLLNELDCLDKIDSQKLFLYFIQEGKSLYTGKPLNIDHLEEYEIDHIIPRSLIKDDSIDNKALVYREENQNKKANYVLPSEYRTERNKEWWQHLKKVGLISAKKFNSLIRREYKEEDIERFINRQLVETRQITKHVANIISNCFKSTKIIYLNANLSNNYREKYELFKFREINDYHHAHDAYLAAVLGEYKEKYLKKKIDFESLKELNKKLIQNKEFKKLQYGYVINSLDSLVNDELNELTKVHINSDTGEVLFNPDEFNKRVEYNLYCNDIMVSRKTEIRNGQFYKQTIYPKNKGNIMLKKNMPVSLYGGYSNVETAYLTLANYKNKNKLIGIPLEIVKKESQEELKTNFIKESLKITNNDILIKKKKIPYETLINYKGQNTYIKGYSISNKNCEISNAFQLKIPKDKMIKWKYTLNKILNNKDTTKINEEIATDDIETLTQAKEILKYLFAIKEKYPLFYNEVNKIETQIDIDTLTKEEIFTIITEMFKLYHCNSVNANLKDFGLGDRIGRLSGNNITAGKIIFRSTTGLRESIYEF